MSLAPDDPSAPIHHLRVTGGSYTIVRDGSQTTTPFAAMPGETLQAVIQACTAHARCTVLTARSARATIRNFQESTR